MDNKGIGGHHSAAAGTVEWLTPPAVLEALGGASSFDLDPCSPIARPWDTARRHYTVRDDGLALPWNGRVWLNPPYANGIIGQWLGRLADHGRGVALIFARTETEVFHRHVWEQCDALLFLEGRLYFHDVAGKRAGANAGAPSVFCAYGADDADILSQCGLAGAFVPLKLRAFAIGFATPGTWIDEVRAIMERADRPMTVAELYRAIANSPKARRNPNWRAKVRQTLQRGPFDPKGDGVWELDLGGEG